MCPTAKMSFDALRMVPTFLKFRWFFFIFQAITAKATKSVIDKGTMCLYVRGFGFAVTELQRQGNL